MLCYPHYSSHIIAITHESSSNKHMTYAGSGLFGYFLWNIDYHLCSYVTQFKHAIGLPWAFVFELHGWWHILTGIGAYVGMALVEYLITIEDGKTDKVEDGFVWPVKAMLKNVRGGEGSAVAKKGQ